jgi:hypothetical protein
MSFCLQRHDPIAFFVNAHSRTIGYKRNFLESIPTKYFNLPATCALLVQDLAASGACAPRLFRQMESF